jgi:hypothetical protein
MMLPLTQPPEGLYEAVLARVGLARRRAARFQFILLAGTSAALTALAWVALQYLAAESTASGFSSYLSLLTSDTARVLSSQEFFLSLVESLPSLALMMALLLAGALAWSLYRTIKSARTAFTYA